MKPKDFKPFFSWEERQPVLKDGLLVVPKYYDRHDTFTFPGWSVFPKKQPVCVEFCSGNGAWIIDRAKERPDLNWVAVEMRFDRVRKIWSKKNNEHLDNLFVVWGEALTFSRFYLPPHTVAEVFINFPDPWPKKRHLKHRLMGPLFVQELERMLEEEGRVTFVTDDHDYLEWTLENFFTQKTFAPLYPEPFYVEDQSEYGNSYFNDLWRELGRTIHYTTFKVSRGGEISHQPQESAPAFLSAALPHTGQ